MNAKYQQPCADLRRDPSPLFWRILQTIYEKNTEMNVQMPFSGPIFPEKGPPPPPPPFKVLDPTLPLFNQLTTNKSYFFFSFAHKICCQENLYLIKKIVTIIPFGANKLSISRKLW